MVRGVSRPSIAMRQPACWLSSPPWGDAGRSAAQRLGRPRRRRRARREQRLRGHGHRHARRDRGACLQRGRLKRKDGGRAGLDRPASLPLREAVEAGDARAARAAASSPPRHGAHDQPGGDARRAGARRCRCPNAPAPCLPGRSAEPRPLRSPRISPACGPTTASSPRPRGSPKAVCRLPRFDPVREIHARWAEAAPLRKDHLGRAGEGASAARACPGPSQMRRTPRWPQGRAVLYLPYGQAFSDRIRVREH